MGVVKDISTPSLRPALIGECPGVEVEVNGQIIPCLLDTGSQVTLMSQTLFRQRLGNVGLEVGEESRWLSLKAANGLQIPYIGYALLDFKVGGVQLHNKGVFIVNDDCLGAERAILGMNIIADCWQELMHGLHPGEAAFRSQLPPRAEREWGKAFAVCQQASMGPTPPFQGHVRLPKSETIVVPAESELLVWGRTSEDSSSSGRTLLVEPLPQHDAEWRVGRALVTTRGGYVPIRLCNPHPYVVEISPRTVLAELHGVSAEDVQAQRVLRLHGEETGTVEVTIHSIDALQAGDSAAPPVLGEGLTTEQQQRVKGRMDQWRAVFAQHEEDFGRTGAVQHQIPTGSAPPSRERYRPVPPSLYPELRSLLKGMLETGVVRESSSPWAAPIVLVKKKDGSWRFCVDYRKLNAVTHKDAYPLPRIEESLTCLKKAAWYSTLDLAAGYWQVEVDPKDREKTAFTTPMGLYEFDRMPFGLCNAPATFQRLMQRCLGGMIYESLLIYLDDVIVYSPDFDSHLRDLETVFRRLQEMGLKLQPKKCRFFQQKVTYLGHVVSQEGVATDPTKTAVVEQWEAPSTVQQLRSFLGFVGYYRRFVQDFAKIAAPLNRLLQGGRTTSKNTPVVWSTTCEQAFRQLKSALVSSPILAYADFTLPFRLYTDASLDGLGAVLSQVQDGKERVIAYASRSLHPTERNDQNYSSFKLEFLALKWAMTEKFKDYLWGATVEVFTDNNPLVHLQSARLGAVEQRWASQLANYNYTLKYRPGKLNQNADILSRLPGEQVATVCLLQGESEAQQEVEEDWAHQQQRDPDLRRLSSWLERGSQPTALERENISMALQRWLREWSRLENKEGVLWRKRVQQGTGEPCQQVLVPQQRGRTLWEEYHRQAGHANPDKTAALLRQRYFWPGMANDGATWGQECRQCITNKPGPAVRAPLVSIQSSYPFQIVGIDYLSLGRSDDSHPYILVMTDLFSKYAVAVPTKDQSATTTARAVWTHLFQVFGCPEQIHSDRGGAFESALFTELCQLYGCRKSRTTPYHPQGNGACERFNQTLLGLLGTLLEEEKSQWQAKLPALLQVYNNTTHRTTNLTPHFMVFGRHARLPVDWIHGVTVQGDTHVTNGWVQHQHQLLGKVYRLAQKHSRQQQGRDKARYDRRARAPDLLPGERVLLRHFRRRAQGKLTPRWLPTPFVIVERVYPDGPVYLIKPEGREGPTKTAHRNNLRPCPVTFPQEPTMAVEPEPPLGRTTSQSGTGVNQRRTYWPLTFYGRRPVPPREPEPPAIPEDPLYGPDSPVQDAPASADPGLSGPRVAAALQGTNDLPLRRSTRSTQGNKPDRYSPC